MLYMAAPDRLVEAGVGPPDVVVRGPRDALNIFPHSQPGLRRRGAERRLKFCDRGSESVERLRDSVRRLGDADPARLSAEAAFQRPPRLPRRAAVGSRRPTAPGMPAAA